MSESAQKLQITEQKTVLFYDDELTAVRADDGHIYVSLRQMCDALGVARQSQVRRINRHAVLSKGLKGGAILAPPSEDGRGGGLQQANLLRVDLVPLWLSGIRVSSVDEAIQEKLTRFQEEAAAVLWEAFQSGRLTTTPEIEDLLDSNSPAAQAYKMAMAMAELARNQLQLEARLANRLDEHETRLEQLEAVLPSPKSHITEDQAMQISQSVKTVAMALGKHTKKNEFGAVYGELYRKFGITSYKMLPAKKFETAINFLTEWHQNLEGDAPF
jgi:hypothetical protein